MKKNIWRYEYIPLLALAGLILFSIVFIPGFRRPGMYLNILTQASFHGIVSLGMLFVLICGDIDLSIGSQCALYGILCAFLMKNWALPPVLAILLTLACATAIGIVLGYCIDKHHLNPMVATIAAAVTFSGIANTIGRGLPIFNIPPILEEIAGFRFLGLFSFSALLFTVLAILSGLVLRYTYWGRFFYAVGCDKPAASLAGVPVRHVRVLAYTLCSFFCALGAIAFMGRIGLASPDTGNSSVLDVLTITALAGAGFSGGRGKVTPVFCAALLLSMLTAVVLALRIASYYQNIIKGAIIFLSISTKMNKP